jgi:hypothetical protein
MADVESHRPEPEPGSPEAEREAEQAALAAMADCLEPLGRLAETLADAWGATPEAMVALGLRLGVAQLLDSYAAPGTPMHDAARAVIEETTLPFCPSPDSEEPRHG